MKYLMLVCWGTESMNDQTEPGPDETRSEETFPGSTTFRSAGSG